MLSLADQVLVPGDAGSRAVILRVERVCRGRESVHGAKLQQACGRGFGENRAPSHVLALALDWLHRVRHARADGAALALTHGHHHVGDHLAGRAAGVHAKIDSD